MWSWYCHTCNAWVLGENVTFDEKHDNCGEDVIWKDDDEED